MFASPSQILFNLFGINIYIYGVVLAFAISVGILISDYLGEKFFELKKETILDMSPYVIVFGIIGARLYYCMLNYGFYLRFPTEILAIRHGGISIHGAILGGFLGLVIFAVRHKISVSKLCDVSSIGLVIGQAIGRWGNFFNSEAFGLPCSLPWKLYIAPQYRPVPFQDCEFFHPAFLYESILDCIIFCILLYLLKFNKRFKSGTIALIYLLLYSFARIIVESVRIDSVRYVFGMPVAIVMSLCIIVLALVIMAKMYIRKG